MPEREWNAAEWKAWNNKYRKAKDSKNAEKVQDWRILWLTLNGILYIVKKQICRSAWIIPTKNLRTGRGYVV